MKTLLYTQRGNRILSGLFWAGLFGVWSILHALRFSPLGAFGLDGGCFIRRITGHSCWSCGLTRMADSLIRLDFLQAFRFNPYFFLLGALVLVYCLCFTLNAFRRRYRGPLFPRFHIWHAAAFALSLLVFWAVRNMPFYLNYFYV